MSSRHHIEDFMRGRIIGKIEANRCCQGIRHRSQRCFKSHLKLLECVARVRSMTPAEDRYIALSAKRNRRTTAQKISFLLPQESRSPEKLLPDV
ncbi:hypothetical protein TNCV_966421 [Trichonephila clavipes]|nr:hypothetical protein TNCV_966421 [Trichonephila clavipes]